MFFYCFYCLSLSFLEYRDSSNEVIVGCLSDISGEVVIPQFATEIYSESSSNYAFKNCKDNITSILFEENSRIERIGPYSFFETNLRQVNFRNCQNLLLLNQSIFQNCKSLYWIILPPKLSIIGSFCFSGTPFMDIELPDSVEIIESYAFYKTNLFFFRISDRSKLSFLGEKCFADLQIHVIHIPRYLNSIAPSAFNNCLIDDALIDPENQNYKTDRKSLFTGTDNSTLMKVFGGFSDEYIVPDYVTSISDGCFSYCNRITSIRIHNNVSYIGENAFGHCYSLESIIFQSNNNLTFGCNLFLDKRYPFKLYILGMFNISIDCSISLPKVSTIVITNETKFQGSVSRFFGGNKFKWELEGDFTPDQLIQSFIDDFSVNYDDPDSINSGSFIYKDDSNTTLIGCSDDVYGEVLIPKNVTKIDALLIKSKFENCKRQITSLQFQYNSQIVSISSLGFYQSNIQTVNFSNCLKLTSLKYSSFGSCDNLKTIILPPNIINIDNSCFDYTSLSTIVLPDSLVNLGDGVFWKSKLETIHISSNSKLATIGSDCVVNRNSSKVTPQKS
ncbi:Leucine Rich Repeat family protein [Trichomonas vaginalis G3]|uniref:Leucine Rich Repeat family protein n=1 Tax=Trichomonas vaginalis (strain ATCC PRA-98 / G3) TaxID=412133 RepID=A2E2G1_TRIV3|nr:Leucine Rich Repeat family protein [Trichomonas vaginalis G3]|eukprot:XP_001325359.1 hypothetical protein [Trichomonas vaginalis G3]